MEHILEMRNISKTFGEVQALRQVDFAVARGEVVGLLGDNGAGKSTLIKIVTGYHHPDSDGGEIYFKGQKIEGLSVSEARKLGIETVYQERALADLQTLWRNIFMGREITTRLGFLDVKEMMQEKGVAIVRALHFDAELIILDEPTMGLSLSETKKLLEFVGGIKAAGKSCIFIDHNVFHVYSVADRVVVLDRGAVAGEFMTKDITLEQLMDKMYRVAQTGHLNGNGSE
jgi:simple sugar transport system ATP-binding protein